MILAAAAIAAARTFARPATRCAILGAAFVLVALTGPMALAIAVLRPAAGAPAGGTGRLEPFAGPLLVGIVALAIALLIELALDAARLRAIKRAAHPIGSVAVRRARIALSDAVGSPTAIGYLHPAIVLPAGFRRRVDDAEWQAVVAHEAAHLARGDDWAKAVQSTVLRLGWWLPGLWILARALDVEREVASDERAVRAAGVRRYAACLLRLATSTAPAALSPAFRGRRAQVAIRVERLLRPRPEPAPTVRAAVIGVATAATLAVLVTAVAAVPAIGRVDAHPTQARRLAVLPVRHAAPARATSLRLQVIRRPGPPLVAPAAVPPAPVQPLHVVAVTPRVHRARAARPSAPTVVGMAPLRPRCVTCFGPLRSPDTASALPSTPAAALAPASVAIATGSGSSGLRFALMSLPVPRALAVP